MSELKKVVCEYVVKTSPSVLYPFLSTPGGLSEWFADDVNVRGNVFHFYWDGSEELAEVISKRSNLFIRFRWKRDVADLGYFEFKIVVDELTNEVALVITDLVAPDEEEETRELWDTQILKLKQVLGF